MWISGLSVTFKLQLTQREVVGGSNRNSSRTFARLNNLDPARYTETVCLRLYAGLRRQVHSDKACEYRL